MHGFALRSDWSSEKDKKAMVSSFSSDLHMDTCSRDTLDLGGFLPHLSTSSLNRADPKPPQDEAAQQGIAWFSKYLS